MTTTLVRRLSVIVFLSTLASTVATVHAAENPRKMTVVSFGFFGNEGVFRREATLAAQVVATRFGGNSMIVKYNTKTGGGATVETLATTLQAEAIMTRGRRGCRDCPPNYLSIRRAAGIKELAPVHNAVWLFLRREGLRFKKNAVRP